MNIGIFIEPANTPLAQVDFKKVKSDGLSEVYVRAKNADYTNLKAYYSKIVSAGLKPYAWIWQGFSHAKELSAMGFNIVMDLETYNMADFIPEVKQLRQDTNGKTLILCTKADGWDGDQRWDLLAPLCDFIMPMLYLGDYKKSTAQLGSYVKSYNTDYPGKIYPALETYMSDATVKPKANGVLQVEINACKGVKGIGLFRYGLSNYKREPIITTTCVFTILTKGNKGIEQTKILQHSLELKEDGIYGTVTETAVKTYQKKKGLVIDGIAGQITCTSLGIWCSK